MKTYSNCEKGFKKQLATSYIICMMAGSFFYRSTFASKWEERHLFLHYKEMPQQMQYKLEEKVLHQMEQMGGDFLKKLELMKCDIYCGQQGTEYVVRFQTYGFETMTWIVDAAGNFRVAIS